MTRQLTARQEAILRYIIRYKCDHDGNSPTIRQVMAAVGYQATSAVSALKTLERRGLIKRLPGRALRIVVVGGMWSMEEPG